MSITERKRDVDGFLARLNGESPRARILLEAGFLEELLRSAIRQRLANNTSSDDLFGGTSSLGLVVLAKHAHSLGLIGKRELDAMRGFAKARNKIAHSWRADFTDLEIQKIAASIQYIKLVGEATMADHQRCFARLDYLGLYLTEELGNRFAGMPPTIYDGGIFTTSLSVHADTGRHEIKTGSDS
ncbi:MAG: hypothetical protein U1E48_15330 [Paracoccaceae bacterium]